MDDLKQKRAALEIARWGHYAGVLRKLNYQGGGIGALQKLNNPEIKTPSRVYPGRLPAGGMAARAGDVQLGRTRN